MAALRGLGFVGMIAGVRTPIALLLPYLALSVTFVLGYLAISRGVIIEPPAFVANSITAIMERITQRANARWGSRHDRPGLRDISAGASPRCLRYSRERWC